MKNNFNYFGTSIEFNQAPILFDVTKLGELYDVNPEKWLEKPRIMMYVKDIKNEIEMYKMYPISMKRIIEVDGNKYVRTYFTEELALEFASTISKELYDWFKDQIKTLHSTLNIQGDSVKSNDSRKPFCNPKECKTAKKLAYGETVVDNLF